MTTTPAAMASARPAAPAEEGSKRLRVCHVIHSLRQGGAEHLLVTLGRVARNAGLEVSVVSLMPDQGLDYARQLRALDIQVRCLALPTRWDVRGLPRATRLIQELHPAVIHTHLKHADIVGAVAARQLQIPWVSTLHVIEDAPTPMKRLKRRAAAQARLRFASRTITVSEAQRAWYLSTFPADHRTVVTVHNGVEPPTLNLDDRRTMRERLGLTPSTVAAVAISILRAGKGHEDLLQAVRQLPADLDVRVLIAGDGPLRSMLEAAVRNDPWLRDRVVFLGFVDEVEHLLAASDLVLQPSHFDALPTSLIYAAAAGVPAIASAVGGIPEIVSDDGGALVPPGDPTALADAIERLARDPHRRAAAGAAARRRFEQRFDAAIWAQRLRSAYEEVLQEGV